MAAFLAPILIVWLKILNWPLPGGHSRVLWDFPCALCGGTRSLKLMLSGDWPGALSMNPLVTVATSLLLVWLLYAAVVLLRRWPRVRLVEWTTLSVRWASGLVLLLVLANWGYVWVMGI